MPDDIAWLVAHLVTYKGFIPTGSPVSQLVAFFTYQQMFDKLDLFSKKHGLVFSLYVDDMTFSSTKPITQNIEYFVQKELENVKLTLNTKKTKKYNKANEYKIITGVAISSSGEIKVPNKRREDIVDSYKQLLKTNDKNESELKSLIGKIQAAKQVEPNIFDFQFNHLKKIQNEIQY